MKCIGDIFMSEMSEVSDTESTGDRISAEQGAISLLQEKITRLEEAVRKLQCEYKNIESQQTNQRRTATEKKMWAGEHYNAYIGRRIPELMGKYSAYKCGIEVTAGRIENKISALSDEIKCYQDRIDALRAQMP